MNQLGLQWWDYSVIVLYFASMLAIGWYFSKRNNDATDFLLGGRKMPYFPVAVSMLMTVFSTYSLVMAPGEIYNHGLDWGILSLIMPFIGVVSVMIFTKFFFKIEAFTPFEYLAYRYDKYARLIGAIGNTYSQMLYAGTVLLTTGKIFEAAAGWPCWLTILVIGVVSIIYTGSGGMKAVVWTDFIQFFVMLFGMGALIITLCLLINGGAWGAVSYAFENGHGLSRFTEKEFYSLWPYVRLNFWALLLARIWGALGTGTGQMTVQRLMATGSVKKAVKAQFTSACLTLPTVLLLDFIGLAIYSYYAQNPDPAVTTGDLALFRFIGTKLPPLIPGIFVASALAAAMSTLSSVFNGDAAVWLKEYYVPFLRPQATEKQQLRFSKIATYVVGFAAVILALLQDISLRYFNQTLVEVEMIFGFLFASVGFNQYFFAICSRKACSLSFWSMLAFGYGLKYPILLWYGGSKRCAHTFAQTGELGLAGPISSAWVWLPAAAVVLCWIIAYIRPNVRKWNITWRVLSVIPMGFTCGSVIWYIFSHISADGQPHVLSFTWSGLPGLVLMWLFMLVWHLWGPEVPKEHYYGLCWGYADKKMIKK